MNTVSAHHASWRTQLACTVLGCFALIAALPAGGQNDTIVFTRENFDRAVEEAAAQQRELNASPNYQAHQRGNAALQAGNWEAALEAFRTALESIPDDQVAYWRIGTSLAQLGRLEEALEAYRKSVALNVRGATWPWAVNYEMGNVLGALGRFDEAEAVLSASIEANATAPAYVARGRVSMSRQPPDFDAALEDFDEALRRDGESTAALLSLGGALLLLDSLEPEQGYFEEGCAALLDACALGECRPLDEFTECESEVEPADVDSILDQPLFERD